MVNLDILQKTHLEYRVKLLNNPDISDYLNTNEKFSLETTLEWFERRNLDNRYDCVFLKDGNIIGMGGLSNISRHNRHAELYMYISTEFQGQGLGYESLHALCNYGFERLDLNKIFLYTFAYNKRANLLYEKLGFKLEGVLRQHTLKNGCLHDRHIYGLLRLEYKSLK